MKLLSSGCAGFLMSMPGALVDAKKVVYDHRTGGDFGVEKMDCGEFLEVSCEEVRTAATDGSL